MATTVIRSTDSAAVAASAILTGNAGSLIAVLDYALVTVLGWGKAFTGTNLAAYRAAAGARHYLAIDDSAPDATALGRNARGRGYETMSAVATGTGLFPTTTQLATSVGLIKSTATGTTARPWIIIGDDRTFYMFSAAGGTDPPNLATIIWTDAFFFGEFLSVLAGDTYRTIYAWASNVSTTVTTSVAAVSSTDPSGTGTTNQALPRIYTGVGTAAWAQGVGNTISNRAGVNMSGSTGAGMAYPNPVDGGLYANLVAVYERGTGTTAAAATASNGLRGHLRGMYGAPISTSGYNDQDTYTGIGAFAGRTLMGLKVSPGMYLFDLGAWPYST